ncbi:hypothetical protein SDC9_174636 [bioreactor metagenome]|uniref:3-phosphoshikimate 1-carboxyvinyltransferase n=1 Tax=bioreactor metagenome TaxID=1076179 RepID=A0A645GJW4_9ZZZZ
MGLAVASLLCQDPVKVTDIEDFDDIWCEFLEDFISLGGKVD